MGDRVPEAALVEAAKRLHPEAVRLSLAIHERPELGFHETAASALLCDFLESRGFAVERGLAGLATAFRAARGDPAAPAWRSWPSTTPCRAWGTPAATT